MVPINAAEKIETDTKAGKDAAEHYNNLTTHMWAVLKDLMENQEIEIEEDSENICTAFFNENISLPAMESWSLRAKRK